MKEKKEIFSHFDALASDLLDIQTHFFRGGEENKN
jgi:hypothetical protein